MSMVPKDILYTYERISMFQSRFSNLAVMNTERDFDTDKSQITILFKIICLIKVKEK